MVAPNDDFFYFPFGWQARYFITGSGIALSSSLDGDTITISGVTGGGIGQGADNQATFVLRDATGSLPNSLVLTAGTGTIVEPSAGDGTIRVSVDDGVFASLTGSIFSGPVQVSSSLNISGTTILWDETSIGDPGFEQGSIDFEGGTFDAILKVNDFGGGRDALAIFHRHSTAEGANVAFTRANSNDGTHAILADGDEIASLFFLGHDGVDYNTGARIRVSVQGTTGINAMPSVIDLMTSPASSNQELVGLQVDSNQDVNVPSGSLRAPKMSGSLQHLTTGIPYLVGSGEVTITTASNGQVTIDAPVTVTSSLWTSTVAGQIQTTSSLVHVNLDATTLRLGNGTGGIGAVSTLEFDPGTLRRAQVTTQNNTTMSLDVGGIDTNGFTIRGGSPDNSIEAWVDSERFILIDPTDGIQFTGNLTMNMGNVFSITSGSSLDVNQTGSVRFTTSASMGFESDSELELNGFLWGAPTIGSIDGSASDTLQVTGSISISGSLEASIMPWITIHGYTPQGSPTALNYIPWYDQSEGAASIGYEQTGIAPGSGSLYAVHIRKGNGGTETATVGFYLNQNTTAIEEVPVTLVDVGPSVIFFSASHFDPTDRLTLSVQGDGALAALNLTNHWMVDLRKNQE